MLMRNLIATYRYCCKLGTLCMFAIGVNKYILECNVLNCSEKRRPVQNITLKNIPIDIY